MEGTVFDRVLGPKNGLEDFAGGPSMPCLRFNKPEQKNSPKKFAKTPTVRLWRDQRLVSGFSGRVKDATEVEILGPCMWPVKVAEPLHIHTDLFPLFNLSELSVSPFRC